MIIGVQRTGSVKSGETGKDAIVFHPPAAEYQYIRLTLLGSTLGQQGELHFQIPRDMVKATPTGDELNLDP